MSTVADLKEKMAALLRDLQGAVDLSIELRARSSADKAEVTRLWEEFLGTFFNYIKQRSREAKDNLLGTISWHRLKLF
ncbi:MAG TPA: hypothetical protein PKA10_06245 [Selenomonadales bacterium]|nr:hypothetical protein [Selenomonadales bacterium]